MKMNKGTIGLIAGGAAVLAAAAYFLMKPVKKTTATRQILRQAVRLSPTPLMGLRWLPTPLGLMCQPE
jgi:hypothetical protein